MSDLRLFGRLARQARPAWRRLAILFLVSLLSSPLALLAPLPLQIAVDGVLGGRPLPRFLDGIVPDAITGQPGVLLSFVALLAVIIALLTQGQSLAQKYLSVAVGERLVLDFRARLFAHAQRLSLSFHDSAGAADTLYRLQTDAPAIRSIIIDGLLPSLSAAATLVAMLYVMIRLDWQLALVALAVAPPLAFMSRVYRPRLRAQSRETKRVESMAMGVVHEVLGALRVVKVFGQEEHEADRFSRRGDEGVRRRMQLAVAEGRFSVSIGLIVAAGTAAVLYIGIGHVRSGLLTLGQLLLLMGYLTKVYDPLKTISRKMGTLQGHLASSERAFALLDQVPDVIERPGARSIERARGAIVFRNVSFAYGDRPALRDVSFEIESGTRVGVVGATGAGKSTLISLLSRFYDPTEGAILLDGVDVRDYRLDDLRRQFAVVLQDSVLFSGSISENIAYAVPRATREQIVAAAHAASAHEFIDRLPQGYDTPVGERGVKLSGGQRQRIALARAFLRDSPILILDEPTSALDSLTEAAIVDAVDRLQEGRTVIVISHRPSAVARCSTVLTMERGRLAAGETPSVVRPARSASGTRRETLLAHPAVEAWLRLSEDQPVPTRVAAAKVKPYKTRPTTVYRLEGAGLAGSTVIAKRCRPADGVAERIVYDQVLPHVPLPGPRYYGAVAHSGDGPDGGGYWLFLEEIHGDKYDVFLPEHRAAAARWLGILHSEASALAGPADLPSVGPDRYLNQMRAARDLIRNHLDNPAFGCDDLAFLDLLLARFDQLEERWDRLEQAVAGLPRTLVHGDFNGKNLRVQASSSAPRILAFDWEDAGWGVPTADLAQVVVSGRRVTASPDLATYLAVVRGRWPECTQGDVDRLATCGAVFRAIAASEWDSHHLAHDWADSFVSNLRLYESELSHALGELGWTPPPSYGDLNRAVGVPSG